MLYILLIDNNDSFTYNIVVLIKSNFKDVMLDVISYQDVVLEKLRKYDRIIFSPGPQLPKDYPILYDIIRIYDGIIPIFGICLA